MRAFFLLFLCGLASLHAAAPVVSNISAAQRPNSRLVDITYDVAADFPTVSVSLQVSSDGGSTFAVPATTLSGAIGAGVATGTAKTITWNAGADWSGQYSTQTRFKVIADDGNSAEASFVLIPAGAFTMGDSLDGMSDAPTRTVTLDAFYMGKYEVTKAEWDEVRTWGLSNGYTDLAAGSGKASNHPAQAIGWYMMVKWCNARSQKDGLTPVYYTNDAQTTIYKTGSVNVTNAQVKWSANGYRLPTEAEWEKAARGGLSGKRFPWGDTISHSQANYRASATWSYDSSGSVNNNHPTYATGSTPYTSPVGAFAANGYGLHDMAGNVFEWCWDWHGTYASGSQTNPRGTTSGSYRVYRGGSWDNGAGDSRVAIRYGYYPTYANSLFGFRVVRSLAP
jgi:formylglycine-generating enzyme required for sulfatase activity